jgi:hypothetical protein
LARSPATSFTHALGTSGAAEATMTIAEIKAEIAQLNAQIQCEPRHYAEALQIRQAKRRREMLQAELLRMERLADLPEATRERLRQHFASFDDRTFERLLTLDERALQQLWPGER